MKADNKSVGSRIRTVRQSKGLTLENFGKLIGGASKGLVGNWEKGVNLPNNQRLKLIADLADLSVNELLYGVSAEVKGNVKMELGVAGTIAVEQISGDWIQPEINTWLQNNAEVEVLDIKFTSSATGDNWGNSALVIYRKEK